MTAAGFPRRVLMTADPIGGVWTYAVELAREFDRLGIQLTLATMGAPLSAPQRQQMAELRQVAVHESQFKLEWMDDPWDDVAAAGHWLRDLERTVEPDVVHLNGFAHGALDWRAPCVVVAHSCVLSWWAAVHGTSPPESFARYRTEVRAGLRGADLVVAPSAAMRSALIRHYGRLRHVAVVRNGRSADGIRGGEKWPLILGAGRVWDDGKNLAALDRAAEGLPWPVCIAGQMVAPSGAVTSLRNAQPLGAVSPRFLYQAMEHAAIYALPARYEPFGLSIAEAALAGCALVLGDIDSLRELWADVALFVSPDDDDGLADTLRWLIDRPEMRRDLGQRARARALGRTPAAMSAAYLERYREARAAIPA